MHVCHPLIQEGGCLGRGLFVFHTRNHENHTNHGNHEMLGVQTPSLFLCNKLGSGNFRQFAWAHFQVISGNSRQFLGKFRQFLAISGNFGNFVGGTGGQSPRKTTVLIDKKGLRIAHLRDVVLKTARFSTPFQYFEEPRKPLFENKP